ncbi:1-phosphatidylinositol 3-phosphate 5-kinase [Galendromus occidentalis]|uniref:1-phosphatidylinositol-3-phosphate 5-kinase n=1 Tax=Galendromus occidentalis TaxID=34638 RepID=A0AAJ7SG25_9ACAR|nr:1-phosphatidylinositol 3-phosphate 5-kinase [Galendromus occidentalis]
MTSQSDLEHYEWRAKGRKLDCVNSLSEFAPLPAAASEVEPPKTSTLNMASQLLYKAASTIVGETSPQKDDQDSIAEAKHTILQRITSILDQGGKVSSSDLSDSAFKQFWMPDSNCKECYECGAKFTTFKRRHHCRICGRIFCANCCNLDMIKKHKDDIDLRVCQYCAADILNYLRSKNTGRATETATVDPSRRDSVSFREEALWPHDPSYVVVVEHDIAEETDVKESLDVNRVWKRTLDVFPFQNHRFQELSYPNTATGTSLVTWIQAEFRTDRRAATAIGQRLIDAGLLETVGQPSVTQFVDATILYRPVGLSAGPTTEKEGDNADPLWVSEIAQDSRSSSEEQLSKDWIDASRPDRIAPKVSTNHVELDVQRNSAAVSRAQLQGEVEQVNSYGAWDLADGERVVGVDGAVDEVFLASTEQNSQPDEKRIPEAELNEIRMCLDSQYGHMEKEMLNQQLASNGLNSSWAEVIIPIVNRVASTVVPPPNNNDIRSFVHVKKVPGGTKKDTSIVWGTTFSKNLVHKDMRSSIENPKVLILQGAITYQRNESKIDTLEPIVMQEQDYVKYAIAKVKAYQPDVLVVEKSVSWLVRERIRDFNVSLITNSKKSVMERIAHLTGSSLVPGLDALGSPTLGTCERFSVEMFDISSTQTKSIATFSGCPVSLGCSVLLRGGNLSELSKLKKVLKFMIFMSYNWKLERAFLLNEVAVPPISGNMVDEDDVSQQDDYVESQSNTPPAPMSQSSVVETRELEPEAVEDNSDPLRSTDPETFPIISSPVVVEEPQNGERYYTHAQFRNILKNTLLSVSPFVKVNPPYMETPAGAACELRQYLPEELYTSEKLRVPMTTHVPLTKLEPTPPNIHDIEAWSKRSDIEILEPHPFLSLPATPLGKGRLRDNKRFRALLADYRARGGRIKKSCAKCIGDDEDHKNLKNQETKQIGTTVSKQQVPVEQDCFSPYNHQQMVVLFFIYSSLSKNAPGFCMDPGFIKMDFYANYDITLGRYLERYCLQPGYSCQCGLEMLQHDRKFVHDEGSIVLNTCKMDKIFLPQNDIFMWTFCRKCRYMSKVESMSKEAYNMSFAKYLELRFHGAAYTCRGSQATPCGHSIHHNHVQYFSTGHLVACFKYVPISIREIVLPPTMIRIKKQELSISKVSDEIRGLSEKSSEFYQTVLQVLMGIKDQVIATKHEVWLTQMLEIHKEQRAKSKEYIEKLNVQLTMPVSEDSAEENCWPIYNSLVRLKNHIADGVLTWNNLLTNFENARKKEEKITRSESVSKAPVETGVAGPLDNDNVDQNEVICDPMKLLENQELRSKSASAASSLTKDSISTDDSRSQSTAEEKLAPMISEELTVSVDAKQEKRGTVKTIFQQFLNTSATALISSPFPATEHYNLNLGMEPPIAVYDTEPSSIIAASLASSEYQSGSLRVRAQLSSIMAHLQESSPNKTIDVLELNNFTLPYSTSKPEQAQLHIDIQFQDASSRYFCRIYYAEQFRKVRSLLFPAGEERFLYSLARCIPWEAQGGKSGSIFCKTLDDRFILKEMSRSEMECFRQDFGIKYFEYISRASKRKHPTVLGKIVGVYRIGYTNSVTNNQCKMDLLVMENLFYERNINLKFDLKGSEQNRLVDDIERDDVVLLDENFMKQMCENPMYIRQHSKKVLLNAINNDSSFLAECKVMDYSLLVGIDTEKNEFVVGIIDYVRQFTWDKKAEMVFKSALSGKSPTVIWPSMYKTRFQSAMSKYFLAVPDRWTPLGKDSMLEIGFFCEGSHSHSCNCPKSFF